MRVVFVIASLCGIVTGHIVIQDTKTHDKKIMQSEEALFGRTLPEDGLRGRVVRGNPLDGCSPLEKASPRNATDLDWFVILVRSVNCTFEDKVRAATNGNYSGAIIFNNNQERIFHMKGVGPELVPSVFIGFSDGSTILNHYLYSEEKNIVVKLYPDEPFDLNAYLLPFAIVVGICFLMMLGIVLFKCVQDHKRNRRHRLPKSALKKLPVIKYKRESSPYDTCCICLDDYAENDKLRLLPCDHAYHKSCIDPWLVKNKRVCPQCRKKVFAGDRDDSEDEEEGRDESAPLLANVRSRAGTGGTFAAGGSFAAAVATQSAAAANSRRRFRRRFNIFSRYQRMDDGYIDNESVNGSPPSENYEENNQTHVAIIHPRDETSSSDSDQEDEPVESIQVTLEGPSNNRPNVASQEESLEERNLDVV